MKKTIIAVVVLTIAGMAVAHWQFYDRGRFTTAPDFEKLTRTVSGNTLMSDADPAVTLAFDPAFEHVGGQQFILYGVADTEQHFFVETHDDGTLKSVYWLQFEGYLPDKPYSYDYDDSPLRLMLGDYEFYTDTAFVEVDPNRKRRRGTDGALARELLESRGFTLPNDYVYARMVYLTDETRRKELMIIFIDDLSSYGTRAADLAEDGPDAERWPDIERAHLDRVKDTLRIVPFRP